MEEVFNWEGYGSECQLIDEEVVIQEIDSQRKSIDEQNVHIGLTPLPTMVDKMSAVALEQWKAITKDLGVNKMPWEISRDDLINKHFTSLDTAELFFNLYAKALGFSVRRGQKRVGSDGIIKLRDWWCSKEGYRRTDYKNKGVLTSSTKALTRQGCKVQMRVNKVKNVGLWVIKEFHSIHSHPLACSEHIQFLRSARSISGGTLKTASTMRHVGVKTSQIMSYMAAQVGGYNKVPFTPKDLCNALYRQQQLGLADCDAATAIGYLQHKADQESGFYGEYTCDDEMRLENLFWSDCKSRLDYVSFGHALAFDTTYRSNKYGKPLLVLVGINNHYKTTIFGMALLKDESYTTYRWALEAFRNCMNGVSPNTVMTDGDQAMQRAIHEVMPSTVHRLCTWHLQRNAVANIKDRKFVSELQKFFRHQYTVEEFDSRWKALVDKYSLQNNVWLTALYERRQQWAETFFRGHFFGGMTTTQRCEGMNWFLKSKGKSTLLLGEFVRGIDLALSWMRYNEARDDYDSASTSPVLGATNMVVVEAECAKVFTKNIFYQIRHEISKEGKFMVATTEEDDCRLCLNLTKYGQTDYGSYVQYQKHPETFFCTCDLVGRKGIPCRHIFACMKHLGITKLPSHLINHRWTKGANKTEDKIPQNGSGCTNKRLQPDLIRFGQLNSLFREVSYLGSHTEESFDFVRAQISTILDTLQQQQIVQPTKGTSTIVLPSDNGDNKQVIKNPLLSKTKGAGVRMWKGSRTLKRCSNCNKHGHNKKTCDQLSKKKRQQAARSSDLNDMGHDEPPTQWCNDTYLTDNEEAHTIATPSSKCDLFRSPEEQTQFCTNDHDTHVESSYKQYNCQTTDASFYSFLDLNNPPKAVHNENAKVAAGVKEEDIKVEVSSHEANSFVETSSWFGTPYGL